MRCFRFSSTGTVGTKKRYKTGYFFFFLVLKKVLKRLLVGVYGYCEGVLFGIIFKNKFVKLRKVYIFAARKKRRKLLRKWGAKKIKK